MYILNRASGGKVTSTSSAARTRSISSDRGEGLVSVTLLLPFVSYGLHIHLGSLPTTRAKRILGGREHPGEPMGCSWPFDDFCGVGESHCGRRLDWDERI